MLNAPMNSMLLKTVSVFTGKVTGSRRILMVVAAVAVLTASAVREGVAEETNLASGSAVLASDDLTLYEPAATFASSDLLTDASAAGLDGAVYKNGYVQRVRTAPATWSSRFQVRWNARWGTQPRYLV